LHGCIWITAYCGAVAYRPDPQNAFASHATGAATAWTAACPDLRTKGIARESTGAAPHDGAIASFKGKRRAPQKRGSNEQAQLAGPGSLAGPLRGRMRDGKRAALVSAIFLVGIVERLQESFLLMLVVLVRLRLGQVGNGLIRHDRIPFESTTRDVQSTLFCSRQARECLRPHLGFTASKATGP
jgi:hypothetical protein